MSMALSALVREKTKSTLINAPHFLPPVFFAKAFELGLNRALSSRINQGSLNALNDKWFGIECTDWPYRLNITLIRQTLVVKPGSGACDAIIKGDFASFLAMIQRKVDPDTLFFRRKLVTTGDTELALEVKNFLDTLDWSEMPEGARKWVESL